MKQFIVLDPVKVAGEVRKPGDILGADLMPDTLIEQLLAAGLIAGFEDGDDGTDDAGRAAGNPDTANPVPPGSVQTSPLLPHPAPPPPPPDKAPAKAPTKVAATKRQPKAK